MLLTDVGVAKCPAGGAAGASTAVALDPVGDGRTGGVPVSVLTTYTHTHIHAHYWAFTRYDRRTDRAVRLVCPTGRSDDRIV